MPLLVLALTPRGRAHPDPGSLVGLHAPVDKTVFFGRYISILRTWAAFLAGFNAMRRPTFLFYNAAGGILWAILYGVRYPSAQARGLSRLIAWQA